MCRCAFHFNQSVLYMILHSFMTFFSRSKRQHANFAISLIPRFVSRFRNSARYLRFAGRCFCWAPRAVESLPSGAPSLKLKTTMGRRRYVYFLLCGKVAPPRSWEIAVLQVYRAINPKAVTRNELYGYLHPQVGVGMVRAPPPPTPHTPPHTPHSPHPPTCTHVHTCTHSYTQVCIMTFCRRVNGRRDSFLLFFVTWPITRVIGTNGLSWTVISMPSGLNQWTRAWSKQISTSFLFHLSRDACWGVQGNQGNYELCIMFFTPFQLQGYGWQQNVDSSLKWTHSSYAKYAAFAWDQPYEPLFACNCVARRCHLCQCWGYWLETCSWELDGASRVRWLQATAQHAFQAREPRSVKRPLRTCSWNTC